MSDVGFVLDNCEVDYEVVSRSFSKGKIFFSIFDINYYYTIRELLLKIV